ncbi:MAG: phosphatase PAP2 family protein [Bacteroidales bacterium]
MMRGITVIAIFIICSLCVDAQTVDARILHSINSRESRFLNGFSKTASASADVVPLVLPIGQLAYGFIAGDRATLDAGLRSTISMALMVGVTQVMKYSINRERPYDRYPGYIVARSHSDSPSFPSGHTSMAAVTAMSLCLEYPKWYIITPATLWALSVGYSRMYLGVHYPSDVAAGLLVGAGSALLTHYGQKWIDGRKNKRAPHHSGALISYGVY